MTRQIILLIATIFFLFSCGGKQIFQVKNEGNAATDSVLLYRQDSTIKIDIGERLTCRPLSSQFIENDTVSMYVLLDENTLYWFDMATGDMIKSKRIEGCATLNNYSGFLCLNDTTFVYNYKQKKVYMLDSIFAIRKSWNIINGDFKKCSIDPEALTDSPIIYSNSKIMLSGAKLRQQQNSMFKDSPISCCINISDNSIVEGANYPEQYMKGDFGGVYFNAIYHTLGDSNNYVYSFPADHYVYFYLPDFSAFQKFYMGSRYSSVINSSDLNSIELFRDKDLRIKYFLRQHSYSNILYDKYRAVYYRIAGHPVDGWESGPFPKPFSIIVMNIDGHIISETPIQKDYKDLNLHNMHVTRDGLLIQKLTSDENCIEFINYKMAGYEK